ncbi:hypothetical protein ACFO9E_05700 [Streptomyces maoxianensis]|uniref:Uncharacterized protein n=1 Tax=Streptomyces maoxianensis TaxID=1459942 RepID=A0ABV9G315_9ACTN
MDHLGVRVDRWELAHTEEGITKTLARMTRYRAPADLPVAIATTRGLVVDRLLAAGHPVVPVHPHLPRDAPALGCRQGQNGRGRQHETRRLPPHRRPLPAPPGAHRPGHPQPAGAHPPGSAPTTSRPKSPPSTSSPHCWTPTGPAARPSSTNSTAT